MKVICLSFVLCSFPFQQAFWVPLSVAFCVNEDKSNHTWASMLSSSCDSADFFGGIVYTLNLIMAFQWGAVIEYDHQEYEESDGPRMTKAYLL